MKILLALLLIFAIPFPIAIPIILLWIVGAILLAPFKAIGRVSKADRGINKIINDRIKQAKENAEK